MATQRFYDGQPGPDIRRELNNFEAILDGTVASAQDASTAATSASVKAQQWADAAPGVEVETGKYSAKHWADRAQTTVTGGLIYRGSHSAASGVYPATPSLGDYYKISVAGTLGGVAYSVGDSIIYNGTDWDKIGSTDAVTSVAGRVGEVVLTKGDVGLGNVDNTSDADKPVSTAQAAALNELDTEKVSNTVELPNATNLDTVVTSGFYRMGDVSNGPGRWVDYGQLIVSRGLDTITQIATAYSSGRMFTRSGNPSSVGGTGAFSPWREVYTSGSILGTVSQSAGVPTGAVIERGSNANGEYVRFADGTQICTQTKAHPVEGNSILAWTFPAVFSAVPAFSAIPTATELDDVTGRAVAWIHTITTGAYVRFRVNSSAIYKLTAIGRWY